MGGVGLGCVARYVVSYVGVCDGWMGVWGVWVCGMGGVW